MDILQHKINYKFKSVDLLKQALTHKSYSNEHKLKYNYDRLEYLGDAVLQMVTSDYLINRYPDADEGTLSHYRKLYVCENALSIRARTLELGNYLLLGRGEELSGGRHKDSILADVLEALIGAIYRDSGIEEAEEFIYQHILHYEELPDLDHKTKLQELTGNHGHELRYESLSNVEGFTVNVFWKDKLLGTGHGRNKKSAEQQAAGQALKKLS